MRQSYRTADLLSVIFAGIILTTTAGAIHYLQDGPFPAAHAEYSDDGTSTPGVPLLSPLPPSGPDAHPPPLQQTGVPPHEVLCNEPRELYLTDSRSFCLFPGTQQALLLRGIDATKVPPRSPTVELAAEEEAWLSDNPVIGVVYDWKWYPIEYADDGGWVAGITRNYIIEFEDVLGVDFEPVQTVDWTSALEAVRERNADVIFMVAHTDDRAEYMGFTTTHYTIDTVLATTEFGGLSLDDPNLRLLTILDYEIEDWLDNNHPGVGYTSVDDYAEALTILQNGEADALAATWPVISAISREEGITIYNAGSTGHSYELAIGYRSDQPVLGSILQKTLDYLPASTLERLQGATYKTMDDSKHP